jgi:hypothetical protein
MLSIYARLRISDVVTFDITKRLNGNNLSFLGCAKQRTIYTRGFPIGLWSAYAAGK